VFSPLLEPTLSGLAIDFSGVLKWAFFIGGGNKVKAKFSKIPSCSFAFGEDLRGCERMNNNVLAPPYPARTSRTP